MHIRLALVVLLVAALPGCWRNSSPPVAARSAVVKAAAPPGVGNAVAHPLAGDNAWQFQIQSPGEWLWH